MRNFFKIVGCFSIFCFYYTRVLVINASNDYVINNLSDESIYQEIKRFILLNAMKLLYFGATIYMIWGLYIILKAGGFEEKIKKGKIIVIKALVIFFIIRLLTFIPSL